MLQGGCMLMLPECNAYRGYGMYKHVVVHVFAGVSYLLETL